jgi:hypothetical protein
MKVLRAMRADEDGKPETGNTARTLGVRTGGRRRDVVVAASGFVLPETGGMSVSPPPPGNLEDHRRPPEYGGIGKDPVWELETDDLPPELIYRPDPKEPYRHGFVEPAVPMPLKDYETFLHATRESWQPFSPKGISSTTSNRMHSPKRPCDNEQELNKK